MDLSLLCLGTQDSFCHHVRIPDGYHTLDCQYYHTFLRLTYLDIPLSSYDHPEMTCTSQTYLLVHAPNLELMHDEADRGIAPSPVIRSRSTRIYRCSQKQFKMECKLVWLK